MSLTDLKGRIRAFKVTGPGLYAIAFVAYLVISFIRNSTYADYLLSSNMLQRWNYLLAAVLLVKIYFFDQQSVKKFFLNSVAIGIGVVVWRQTHAIDVLMYLLLILGARGISFAAINEWFLKIGTLLLLFMMFSVVVGLIKDLVFIRDGVDRHSLGILYPTDFAAHVFFLIVSYCYYAFRRLTWYHYLSFVIIAIVLMVVTQARLDVLAILLVIPVFWIAKQAAAGHLIAQVVASFYWMIAPILAYVTMIAAIFYSNSNHLFTLVDHAVSGRLQLSHLAWNRYGLSGLGNHVLEHGFGAGAGAKMFYATGMEGKYFYIDSSFIRLLIIYGLVAVVFFVGTMLLIGLRSTLTRDYRLAAVMLLLAISCVIEQHLLNLAFDPFLIALLAEIDQTIQQPNTIAEV